VDDKDTIDPESFIEQTLFSTLKIELLNNNDELQSIGTGFLIRVEFPQEPSECLILLISNRHVLDTSERFNITFHQRRKDSNLPELGQILSFRTTNYREALFVHPDPNIDLACVNISTVISQLGSRIYYKFLDKTMFANFTEPELDAGQKVIFIGYPENRYDQKHNLPVLRSGVTASHPKLNYNGEEQFLIDAQVFPGSSGSPVFLNMKEAQYSMGQIILDSGMPYRFIGVVSATMIRNNIVSPLPTKQLGISEEIIGLGLVFKATALNGLIDLALEQTWLKMHSNEHLESGG
jgi:V8-like Glu-specific endopeptidase